MVSLAKLRSQLVGVYFADPYQTIKMQLGFSGKLTRIISPFTLQAERKKKHCPPLPTQSPSVSLHNRISPALHPSPHRNHFTLESISKDQESRRGALPNCPLDIISPRERDVHSCHEPQITLDFLAISIYVDKILEKLKRKEEKGK